MVIDLLRGKRMNKGHPNRYHRLHNPYRKSLYHDNPINGRPIRTRWLILCDFIRYIKIEIREKCKQSFK